MSVSRRRSFVLFTVAVALLLLAIGAASSSALPQSPQGAIQRASGLLQESRSEEALRELDRALEDYPSVAMLHFLRGMALGQLGREEDAQQAFLMATQYDPGWPEAHFRAALSSYFLADYDTCWEQSVLAHVAGRDMTAEFGTLRGVSDPPADLEVRLNAPRVYVEEVDLSALQENRALENALMQSQPYLDELRRQTRFAVLQSPHFGLVPRADLAQYILVLEAEDLGGQAFEGPTDWRTEDPNAADPLAARTPAAQSWELDAYLKLFLADEQVYRRQMRVENLTAVNEVGAEMRRQIGYLESWLEQER